MARIGNVDIGLYFDKNKGINNLLDEHSIDNESLIDAVNVDITKDGLIQSRHKFTQELPLTNAHSIFADNNNMYYVSEDNLYKRNKSGVSTVIDVGYDSTPTKFIKFNGQLLICNNAFVRRYNGGKIYDIAPPTVDNWLFNMTYGSMVYGFAPGTYQVAITLVFDDGVEGGTGRAQTIELNSNQKFIINDLPFISDPNIALYRVYLSEANGTTLYHYDDFPSNSTSLEITPSTEMGHELMTQYLSKLKPGDFIEEYRGVIYTSKGSKIYSSNYTKNFPYLTDNRYDWEDLGSGINLLVSTDDGIYTSNSDGIYFLKGDHLKSFVKDHIYESPAVYGMVTKNILTRDIFIFTKMGQIVAGPSGQIKNITEEMFIPKHDITMGASYVRYKNGLRQIVNSFEKGDDNGL